MPFKKNSYGSLYKIWQSLPKWVRKLIFLEVIPLIAPRISRHPSPKPPLTILAPFSSSIGIGWGGRGNARILDHAGFEPRLYDWTNVLFSSDLPDKNLVPQRRKPDAGPGVLLFHANPNHLPALLLHLGKKAITDKYIIGYAVWELPRLPPDWERNLRCVHSIWCPSSFAAQAFRAATDNPVHVVPHCVDPPAGLAPDRERFGIARDTFAVLTAIHLGSGLTRKNPLAAIEAFRSAFPNDQKAVLLVKVSQADSYPDRMEDIEKAIQGAENIRLIKDTLGETDYWSLLASIDSVLSLHRSEGFGLVPAQAMALGKLAISTGWSGNMDYMNRKNSLLVDYSLVPINDPEGNYHEDGQLWADPDVDHAAARLRQAAENTGLRQRIGARAMHTVSTKLGPDAIARTILDQLADLGVTPGVKARRK